MSGEAFFLSPTLRSQISAALRQVRQQIRWKPDRALPHLEKRIRLGHLAPAATLADYEVIIHTVLHQAGAVVYVFRNGGSIYPTVVAQYQDQFWLVMFGLDSVMETAFPPDEPITYFQNPKYQRLGLIEEFIT